MVEVHGVLPHILVGVDVEVQDVEWASHQQPTGVLTAQLHGTFMATLELLQELHDVR